MLTDNTTFKLHEMKFSVMVQAFRDQLQDPACQDFSFEDRFGLLVDAEWAARKNNRLTRLIRSADYLYSDACVENIDYLPGRKLDKAQIDRLATNAYIHEAHNVLLLGATGSGKTYIANALGMSASRNFFTVRYVRCPICSQNWPWHAATGHTEKSSGTTRW